MTTTNDPQQQPYSVQQQPPPSASESTAVRAYPIEAEKALEAWMADKEQQGIWTSPAGWWYAAWMHREAEVATLRSDLAWANQNYEWSVTRGRIWVIEIENLRAELAHAQTERDRFKNQVDSCQGNAYYQAAEEAQKECDQLRSDLAHAQAERDEARQAGRDAANQLHDRYLELADTLKAVRQDQQRTLDQRDQLRAQVETMRDTIIEIARELHRTAHMTDVEWERCPAMKCRQSRAALDQAQPSPQQEVQD